MHEGISASQQDKAYLVEIQHGMFETRSISLMRPHILPFTVPVPPDLHGLLEIGGLGSESSDFTGISRLGYAFTANLDVATV